MPRDNLTFEILWLVEFGAQWPGDSGAIIGRDEVKRYDLTAAMTAACNMLKAGKGNSGNAHGFIVRRKETNAAR